MPKMESNKVELLKAVQNERGEASVYPDEVIFSNLYYVSFSHALRAIEGYIAAGRSDEFVRDCRDANEWIAEKSPKVRDINVINFDGVVALLGNGSTSCDALFYNFNLTDGEFHFITEFKNTGKLELLRLLKSDQRDGIYRKVKDSIENIRNNIVFGGNQEADDIICNMHFFIVYNGKNTAATLVMPKALSKAHSSKGENGKQNHATRTAKRVSNRKDENEIYRQFGEKIKRLNMKPCTEDTFPGNAIPRVRKSDKGSERIRYFTIFSAQDFGELIDSTFFDNWKWGPYLLEENEDSETT